MTINMMLVQRFADMKRFGNSKMADGSIGVEFFHPYTRSVWEFRVDGVVVDRRYSPKTAAAFFVELKNEEERTRQAELVKTRVFNADRLPRVVCPHCHQESETRLYLGVCEECNAHFNQRDLGSKY
jgi:hypothetical protein